jgi:hypothetical protein
MFDSMASGKQTDVAVMDFSKAFDKVDHQRLNRKLKRMGINNKTSNWIGDADIVRYTIVSSAKRRTLLLRVSGMSFMYIRNIHEPRTEPWGMPDNTGQDHKFQMHDIIITPEGTSKLLKNLNPTKTIGPDKISHMISDLFESSVNTGTLFLLFRLPSMARHLRFHVIVHLDQRSR